MLREEEAQDMTHQKLVMWYGVACARELAEVRHLHRYCIWQCVKCYRVAMSRNEQCVEEGKYPREE